MLETELKIKEIILDRYGSLKKFCEKVDLPWTTLDSILKRGFANSNIVNVMKITKELGIDTESLAMGEIVPISQGTALAAHFEGADYTEDEIEEILNFAKYVKSKRK